MEGRKTEVLYGIAVLKNFLFVPLSSFLFVLKKFTGKGLFFCAFWEILKKTVFIEQVSGGNCWERLKHCSSPKKCYFKEIIQWFNKQFQRYIWNPVKRICIFTSIIDVWHGPKYTLQSISISFFPDYLFMR